MVQEAQRVIDEAQCRKAYKLSQREGVDGKALKVALGVDSARTARHLASIGREMASREKAALTAPELLLLRCLAAVERRELANGSASSPKGKQASWKAGKADGWAAATAAKRLGLHRKGEDERYRGTGLNLLHASRNGHMWLTAAGWALIQAFEAAA